MRGPLNAALNAAEFGGGILLAAGSNRPSDTDVMDGRMDTFWSYGAGRAALSSGCHLIVLLP